MWEATIEKHLRPANITDALRALGALCVVWYHNPTYWSLSDTAGVDAAKLILLGWSMPFFYANSAKFALVTPDKRTVQRIGQLLRLIVTYFLLYEAVGFHQLWYDLAASRISSLLGSMDTHSVAIYMTVGVLITAATATTVVILERYLPAAVSLQPRPTIRKAEAN